MSFEKISYIITFILSAGIASLAIMISVQLYQQFKKPLLAQVLYHQIFLFSFLTYSIWGNIILKTILGDIQMSQALSAKLAVFVPMIGVPFMIVSWFMLLKAGMTINGFGQHRKLGFIFFPTLVVLILLLDFLIYLEIIPIPGDADLFIVRILSGINLLVFSVFVLIFFISTKTNNQQQSGFNRKAALFQWLAVFFSSAAMSFFSSYGTISICIAVLFAFAASALLPVYIYLNHRFSETKKVINFDGFCELYEISKRESEIVLEICNGKSNKAIADKLFITLQTVKDHNHRIFTKTGVKSRVQLANLMREKTGQN